MEQNFFKKNQFAQVSSESNKIKASEFSGYKTYIVTISTLTFVHFSSVNKFYNSLAKVEPFSCVWHTVCKYPLVQIDTYLLIFTEFATKFPILILNDFIFEIIIQVCGNEFIGCMFVI